MTDGPHDERMSDLDAIIWAIEDEPRLRSTITAVLFFDHLPDRDLLTRRVERATERAPRLRQRVRNDPFAAPRWETIPHFTLGYHLRWTYLSGSGTRRDVLDLAAPIAMQAFDPARPLWELTIVGGLHEGRAAAVAKVHHSLVDGVGGVELMLELFDFERHPPERAQPAGELPAVAVPGTAARYANALVDELEHRREFAQKTTEQLFGLAVDPADGFRRTVATAKSALRLGQPTVRPMSPLLEASSLSCAFHEITRPLAGLAAAARACDARINDVFITGLCRGLARWHHAHDLALGHLRMGMAINVRSVGNGPTGRSDGRGLGATTPTGANQFLPTRFDVPIDIPEPRAHVVALHELLHAQRHEPALALIEPLATVLRRLPRPAVTALFATVLRGQDFVASNVPGAPVPLWFAGAEITDVVAFGPLSGTALNITLFSHNGTAHIGVNLDPVTILDGEALVAHLAAGLDEVLALGAPTPAPSAPTRRSATTPPAAGEKRRARR